MRARQNPYSARQQGLEITSSGKIHPHDYPKSPELETIKAMVDLHAPISGTVVEVNAALNASPEIINQSPYEAGWLAVIEPSAWSVDHSKLLGPAAYFAVMQAQVQQDLKGL